MQVVCPVHPPLQKYKQQHVPFAQWLLPVVLEVLPVGAMMVVLLVMQVNRHVHHPMWYNNHNHTQAMQHMQQHMHPPHQHAHCQETPRS